MARRTFEMTELMGRIRKLRGSHQGEPESRARPGERTVDRECHPTFAYFGAWAVTSACR
jgi:hypothetical protein